ncbi:MAG: penicillin acylase [Flavobacteriaceae bacterium]|nr:MAG: penicillin acylase [Flavobacteriaceae bacterium]
MFKKNVLKYCLFTTISLVLFSCSYLSKNKDSDVTIIRDKFGIPHIYAKNTLALFYGYGIVVAQDRLFQMEMIKRATNGSVSEVLGKEYLQFDKNVKTNLNINSIHKQYNELSTDEKAIFEGYSKGINSWIDSVRNKPSKLMPKQFIDFKMTPTYWKPIDVVIVFVGTMCNRYSDFTTEIQNLQFLQALEKKHGAVKAVQIFDQLLWKYDANALSTISKKNKPLKLSLNTIHHYKQLKKVAKSTVYQQSPLSLNSSSGELKFATKRKHYTNRVNQLGLTGVSGSGGYPSCSNIVVIGKEKAKNANAIILNGPQFGWFTPSYVYGIGLHGAGFDLVGNTPFAYPAVLFGSNKNIGWGATAGFGDLVDIFEEQLNPYNHNQYLFKKVYSDMNISYDTIKIKNEADIIHTKYSTIHGPVIAWDKEKNIAYSKKRSWDGFEIESLLAWINSTKSTNYKEWNTQASSIAISINWYYADKKGNIAYVHNGKIPKRHLDNDFRLPSKGDGTMEWEEILPFEKNPQVYNPESGYIANWNNAPEKNYNSPDMFWLQWSITDRNSILDNSIKSANKLSPTDVKELIKKASFTDLNYAYFMPLINSELKSTLNLTKEEKTLLKIMNQWDGLQSDINNDNYYDAIGYTVFKKYLESLLKEVFKNDIPSPFYNWYASAGYRNPNQAVYSAGDNIQPGTKVLYNILSNSSTIKNNYDFLNGVSKSELLKKCLVKTYSQIISDFKTENPEKWHSRVVKTHYLTNNFLGIPQANKDEIKTNSLAMNRGTENNLIIFNNNKIEFKDVISPGESGFINPKGEKSKHYEDQLQLYEDFNYKTVHTTLKEVLKNSESIQYLNIYSN